MPLDDELAPIIMRSSESEPPAWMMQNLSRIQSGGNKMASSAQLAYLAFLGYYLGQANRIRSNRADVVKISNDFSEAIGLAHVPALSPKLVTKMELGGVPGVFIDNEEK